MDNGSKKHKLGIAAIPLEGFDALALDRAKKYGKGRFDMEIKTIEKNAYDVIVAGGGIAGVSAALAAARGGAKVLLLEKQINLGGLATVGLVNWYEPLCDGEGHQMIGGIAAELIRLSAQVGFDDLPPEWGGDPRYARAPSSSKYDRFATHFSPTFFSLALDRLLLAAGVELLFDVRVTYPVMENGVCRGLLAETVEGRVFYPAKIVIDATGDATVLSRAGVPCALGNNYLTYAAEGFDLGMLKDPEINENLARLRKCYTAGSSMTGKGHPEGLRLFHGDSAEEETEFLLRGKDILWQKFAGTDRRTRELMDLPAMPQLRTIRHLVSDVVFRGTEENVVFADSIGATGDFRTRGKHYTLPYAILRHADFPNLLAAGRIVSAEGDGWEITRVIPDCALTGEAAGVAAALCVRGGYTVNTLPYETLRGALESAGVLFDIRGK